MISYDDTIRYLNSLVNYENSGFRPGDKRMAPGTLRRVLTGLGDPDRDYRCVHIAGTKGKGSVCAFTASILEASGYRVGQFTSPHLIKPEERIQVNGKCISRAELAAACGRLLGGAGKAARDLTFFEAYTLLSMIHFSMKKVDLAVFETGLGGRLDATNVIDPDVCGITPVSYDHTHVLGNTLEAIAGEKAGIIKNGCRCVTSEQRPSALRVIKRRCASKKAPIFMVGKEITYDIVRSDGSGSVFNIHGLKKDYKSCRTAMQGYFQPANCAQAAAICEETLGAGNISVTAFKKGIRNTFLPGRLEVLCRRPLVVIDGAQNAESAARLKYSVEHIFKYDRLILLAGLSRDKDIKGFCGGIEECADRVVLTRSASPRAADPEIIRGYIKGRPVRMTDGVKEAVGAALAEAGPRDMILAAGSFYVIGEVRQLLRTGYVEQK